MTRKPPPRPAPRLYDTFAGHVEVTVQQRNYVLRLLEDAYLSGTGWMPPDVPNKREFHKGVVRDMFGSLKLTRMVTPDGLRHVSVEEHDALVKQIYEHEALVETLVEDAEANDAADPPGSSGSNPSGYSFY